MDKIFDYSEIAPYQDHDVKKVLDLLKKHTSFLNLLRYLKEDVSVEAMETFFEGVETIDDFQKLIVKPRLLRLFNETTSGITHEGIEALRSDQNHLFISNHRDIILDSAILNVFFSNHAIQTVEIAIGDNLLESELVKILTKLNKNFTVIRNAGPRKMYANSLTLSSYIRKKIVNKESSIWIAQREGRAKDGNDKTQQGLIKMLNLSNENSFEEGFKALNICPVSMSYEYDPCDPFKLKEILAMEEGKVYVKEKGEDYKNLLSGLLGHKGRVHLSIQPVMEQELDQLREIKNINDKTNQFAEMIDRSIYKAYKLFENNYAAYDMLYDVNEWEKHYSKEKKQEFEAYLNVICKDLLPAAKKTLLKKYAYPLINRKNLIG